MAITPTGSPVWLRQNDHTKYGGDTNKKNYQSRGAINAQTDLTAENVCRIAADMAAIGKTAPFCSFIAVFDDSNPGNPSIAASSYLTMAGSIPTAVRVGDGHAYFDWDASYTDDYSQAGDFNIVGVQVSLEGSSAGAAVWEIEDDNTDGLNERLVVRVFDAGGAARTSPTVGITVWTGPSS